MKGKRVRKTTVFTIYWYANSLTHGVCYEKYFEFYRLLNLNFVNIFKRRMFSFYSAKAVYLARIRSRAASKPDARVSLR